MARGRKRIVPNLRANCDFTWPAATELKRTPRIQPPAPRCHAFTRAPVSSSKSPISRRGIRQKKKKKKKKLEKFLNQRPNIIQERKELTLERIHIIYIHNLSFLLFFIDRENDDRGKWRKMGDVSEEVESLSSNRAAGTLNPSYNILKRGAFSEDNLRLAKWIRRTGERGGEKEKRGEELETEEGGEVGLRSRRKSWLITSLQRDDRFPTSRGERERKTDRERERGQPRSSTPALQLVATTLHASRSSSRLYTGGIRYTLLRLAVFYDQLRADSECLCKPAKPFGFKLSGIFYHFFPFFLFCLLSLSLPLHFPTTTTTLKRKRRRNCRQTTKDFLLSNEILLGTNILFGDKTSSFPFLHLLLSRLED